MKNRKYTNPKNRILRLFKTNNMIDCSVAISVCISKGVFDEEVEAYIRKHLSDERVLMGSYKVKCFSVCALLLLNKEDLRGTLTDARELDIIERMLASPEIFDDFAE